MPKVDFKLYLIGDRHQTLGRPLTHIVQEAALGGVSAFQFREKDLSLRAQLLLAEEIQAVTRLNKTRFFINDRIDLCLLLDADGAHLSSTGIPVRSARKLLGDKKWIAVSCHNLKEVQRAEAEGADFALLGPVYDTPSKRPFGVPLGIDYFKEVRSAVSLPLFAVGGIKKDRLNEVFTAGADGVALISAISSANDVQKTAREIIADINQLF